MNQPIKDLPTVTPQGQSLKTFIDGVIVRRQTTQEDERGELCEIFNPAWGICPQEMVYAYMATLRPGKIKGWVKHEKQEDRLFIASGTMRWALYDDRADSPTHRQLNVLTLSEKSRSLLVIPRGVFHAVQNVGTGDALFFNLPTAPYNHANPDKLRLPVQNDLIPFAFEDKAGW